MDMSAVSQIISTVGFPIFVAVWMLYKSSEDSKQTRQALNDLTIAVTKLSDRIDKGENNDKSL